ncbi:MAG: STT3 domain-containing protein [Myxococcota bacterium]
MHRIGSVWRLLVPLLLGTLAFAVRALPWPGVFGGAKVQLAEVDAWYHMRRIVYALRNAPDTLGFDPFLNFPDGGRAIWPSFLDTLTARVVGAWVGTDAAAAERMVAWLPPLLGALTVVVFYGWMRRHFGFAPALIGAAFLSVLSGSSWYARVGLVDHHVAVALVATALLGAGMELLHAFDRRAGLAWWVGSVGVLFAGLIHVWPGALLHIALLEVGLVAFGLAAGDRTEAARFARAFAGIQAVACAILLLAGWPPSGPWGDYAPTVLSRFQPLFFAAIGVASLACALLWRFTRAGANRIARSAQAVGLAAGLAGVLIVGVPGLLEGIADAWTWLGRGERFQASVLESRPLLFAEGVFDLQLASQRLSRFAFVLPAAWVFLLIRELRGDRRPAFLLLAVYAAGSSVATLLQARFFNSAAVPVAAFFALSLVAADAAGVGPTAGRLRRVGVRGALGLAVLWLWWPVADAYRIDLSNQLPALRGEPIVSTPEDRYFQALFETATWLRERTPSPGDPYAAGTQPSFGVLGHWQYGHVILYVAERPAVVGNFGDDLGGDNYRLSFEYFALTEARAVELLDRLRARYVLIRPLDVAGGDLGAGCMIRRLADPDGGSLARHRLVFERQVIRQHDERPRSHFRVFERVAGAMVVGRAEPGSVVEARLPYVSPTGRKGEFDRRATANEHGMYHLRLPYATRGGPTGIPVADAWQVGLIDGDRSRHPVVVPERDVIRSGRIEGPDLIP